VYTARIVETGQVVAVKQFSIIGTPEPTKLQTIAAEVDTMLSIKHPNVLTCVGSQHDASNNVINIFLELVDHGSIASKIQRDGALKDGPIQRYTTHIVAALMHLHAQNIIHRDIKGANCLIAANDVVKVADFGSAAQCGIGERTEQFLSLDAHNGTRGMRGTPYFMAPEVIKGHGYGRRSDVWSLGCTVVEMANGRPPWSHIGNHIAAMFRITSDDEPAPIPPSLPSDAQAFLFRCFVRKQAKRATAEELAQHRFLTKPISPSEPPSPKAADDLFKSAAADRDSLRDSGSLGGPPRRMRLPSRGRNRSGANGKVSRKSVEQTDGLVLPAD